MSNNDPSRKRLEDLNRGPLPESPPPDAAVQKDDLRRQLRKRGQAPARAALSGLPRPDTPTGAPGSTPRATGGLPARDPPEASSGGATQPPIVFHRDLPRRSAPRPAIPELSGPYVMLEKALADVGSLAVDGSGVFIVQRRLLDHDEAGQELCDRFRRTLEGPATGLRSQLAHAGIPAPVRPEDLLFFDLETTGLASTPLFLIGAMVWDGRELISRQFFARDYSQEAAAVRMFLDLAAGRRLLVSFNGRTFDEPYVRARAVANGLTGRLDLAHFDLLHAARRIWRTVLPDCKLQTLERYVCGRRRCGDIPGHEIPDAYHAYVRTGNAYRMLDVLEHNFLDLLTMADLLTRIPPIC